MHNDNKIHTPATAPKKKAAKSVGKRTAIAIVALIVVGATLYHFATRRPKVSELAMTTAKRGSLDITVLEGGSIKALETQDVKCEVRPGSQGTKILKIIEEGYQVTDEDVRTNKVLIVLDSSEMEKQLVQQEIQYQSAAAALTDAQQGYDIQLNQNISDQQKADQDARFARMDFDKYVGETVGKEIIGKIDWERTAVTESTNAPVKIEPTGPAAAPLPAPPVTRAPKENGGRFRDIDFSKYANLDALGDGEAKQKLRKFEDDLQVAQKELATAKSKLDGSKRLFEKGFVTRIELEQDELAYENARLKVQTAGTDRDLFLKYDFRKAAEEALSKYAETLREVKRGQKAAVSKMAQAESKLKSCQAQFNVQERAQQDLKAQMGKYIIHATKPGLVAYGGDEDRWGSEPIREGATLRERQTIITIPDMKKMSVTVRIHESYVKKVKKGQKAKITVDAFPDQVMDGEVTKVGTLPDSQNSWLNPDLKVYLTTITINNSGEWLKPGMSAKVEIMVDHLTNIVYVPLQAVVPGGGKQLCYVMNGDNASKRELKVGQFNDSFIEVKDGLKEGEQILLHPPERAEPGAEEKMAEAKPPTKSK